MGLFGNNEEKQLKKEQKEMEMMARYGLENLKNPADVASVKKIISELSGTGLMEAGMKIGSFGKSTEDLLPVYYQRTLMEQNWIIIRQLDRIASMIETTLSN